VVRQFHGVARRGLVGSGAHAAGCAMFQGTPYKERHEIRHLTVVLADEDSIREKWEEVSRKPSVKIITIDADATIQVKIVRGFYDRNTRTIHCPKMNSEMCGHELFHAIFGKFHPEQ
jgi:hypothetical protein